MFSNLHWFLFTDDPMIDQMGDDERPKNAEELWALPSPVKDSTFETWGK